MPSSVCNDTATTEIYTLSLHDALPIFGGHDLENVTVMGRGVLTTNNIDWMRLHSRALRSVSDAGSANGANWERLLEDLEAQKPISEEEYAAAASELRPSFR